MMGHTLFHTGEFVEAKAHFDKGTTALYNAARAPFRWRRAFGLTAG